LSLYIVELPRSIDKGAAEQGTIELALKWQTDGNLTQQAPESYCFEESGKHHCTFSWQKGRNT